MTVDGGPSDERTALQRGIGERCAGWGHLGLGWRCAVMWRLVWRAQAAGWGDGGVEEGVTGGACYDRIARAAAAITLWEHTLQEETKGV